MTTFPSDAVCNCGQPFVVHFGTSQTLVGYSSPPGHDHDDNCRKRVYRCKAGHYSTLSKRNCCPAEGCDWAGKTACGCHQGLKLDEWPAIPIAPRNEILIHEGMSEHIEINNSGGHDHG